MNIHPPIKALATALETEVTDEIKSRKDSVNQIADIEEAVPNETEDKNIDKQR